MNKDLRKFLTSLEDKNYRVERGSKHIKVYSPNPDHPVMICSSTPGDDYEVARIKRRINRFIKQYGV